MEVYLDEDDSSYDGVFHHETVGLAKRMPYPVQKRSLFRETNSVDKLAGLA